MRAKLLFNRMAFLAHNVEGTILDVGCQDASGWASGHQIAGKPFSYFDSIPNITYFDMDKWSHPNFVRGDAHHLPFKNNSFDTVVSGDVLEHVIDPANFIKELIRTARTKVIITTPDEYQWHKDLCPFMESKNHPANVGMTEDEMAEKDTVKFKSFYAKCTDFVKESKMKHLYHIRRFTPHSFIKLVLDATTETVFQPEERVGSKCNYTFEINHLYHPLAPTTPEEPQDMAYWSFVLYKV